MTVSIVNSNAAATGRFDGKQLVPSDYLAEVSQRLVDAVHRDDMNTAEACMIDPLVDVNFVGTVSLRSKRTEIILCGELPHEVRTEYQEFRTEVTALFLAAHAGNLTLVRKLVSSGADVNQKLFMGYAATAAVREGHVEILEVLINGGACQQACEEALLEASYVGESNCSELLLQSQMIRHLVAVRALILASSRGFVDVVRKLITSGVDANAINRILLQSSKPSLHINVDCNALVAAIISRQVSVVILLLQAGVRTDIKLRLGAWSWDVNTGEEFRVGAGLSEPYSVAWCAVEYFEASGSILQMLLQSLSPETTHYGRTLIHHAILCQNDRALEIVINAGGDVECPIKTPSRTEHPIHLAARIGLAKCLQCLIAARCDVNSRTESGDTAAMICARNKQDGCLKLLASAGADMNLTGTHNYQISHLMPPGEEMIPVEVDIHICPESDQRLIDEDGGPASGLSTETQKILPEGNDSSASKSINLAAREGEMDSLLDTINGGSDMNTLDPDGYTPLKATFDEIARKFVLEGGLVKKHTRSGKGAPHMKNLMMVEGAGVLRWGKSRKRNVVCKMAEVGPSSGFTWNRRSKLDVNEPGLFRVVTTRNKEVHFVCEGGDEMAQLWVRGIEIVTREAIFGNK